MGTSEFYHPRPPKDDLFVGRSYRNTRIYHGEVEKMYNALDPATWVPKTVILGTAVDAVDTPVPPDEVS